MPPLTPSPISASTLLIPPPSPMLPCSTLLSVYLYAFSFRRGVLLCAHGCSGYPHYDFWMGRELNPRVRASGGWRG